MRRHSILGTGGVGWVLALAVAAVSGCAVVPGRTAIQLTAPSPLSADYMVCSGGHGSRFPGREEVGRICRRAAGVAVVR
jgi:hypothetical protein